jgi:5-methyltetrahydropteroyltriglutamate--homocysteine methyltransferase
VLTSQDRILTTHTGSLPRPEPLTELYVKRDRGETVDGVKIESLARDAVRQSVENQSGAGIDNGNNGEQPRDSFFLYLRQRLTGLDGRWQRPSRADVERYPEFKKRWTQATGSGSAGMRSTPTATGDVVYKDPDAIRSEIRDFVQVLEDNPGAFREAFMSSPSPGIVASAIRNDHYDTLANYLAALSRALRIEYEAIVEAGLILQIDAPDLALERHMTYKDEPVDKFVEFVEMVVAAINDALENVPRDRVRLHVCWGNSESPHDCDVPLADILPTLMTAKVGGFVLPFANPRHAHEFKNFAKYPLAGDQILVAGVIDTLTNFVEHPEVVADRLERVAAVVGDPTRVLAGTDCGFDTSAGRGRVAPDVVWAKIKAMREGADIASKRLFA